MSSKTMTTNKNVTAKVTGSRIRRLPSRFPDGTRYIIEGRGGHVHLRYLEFPNGRKIELPSAGTERPAAGRAVPGRRGTEKSFTKKTSSRGTVRRLVN
jgi:hypothetical protein